MLLLNLIINRLKKQIMKNDLTRFEQDLLSAINLNHRAKYNHTHLMEWSTSKEVVAKNIQDGEKIFEALGCYVAIKIIK